MKMIAIGGEPATGKSSVMLAVMKGLTVSEPFKHKKVVGHKFPNEKVLVLGVYAEGQGFPGTDRLSMACQPDAIDLLDRTQELALGDYTIVFEGDRLFTGSFLEAAKGKCERLDALMFTVSESELQRRHGVRGDNQSAQFKKSRATKCKNLVEKHSFILKWANESEADRDAIAAHILGIVKGEAAA